MISLLDLIYPENITCICCGEEIFPEDGKYSLCETCLKDLSFTKGRTCHICGREMGKDLGLRCRNCSVHDLGEYLDGGISVFAYKGTGEHLIKCLKYSDKRYVAKTLGFMLYEALETTYVDDIHLLIPVPAHWTRDLVRGFNQSEMIAKRVSTLSKIPWSKKVLKRKRITKRLSSLEGEKRIHELDEAFCFFENTSVKNKNIGIVDDIFTSGTTAKEIAKTLKNAGANQVYIITVAVGGDTGYNYE